MKLIGFIMAFLIITLNCLPCEDGGGISSSAHEITQLAGTNQQDTEHSGDDCSPFCQCQCCSTYSINHVATATTDHVFPESRNYNSYYSSGLFEISLPVWQPPRLV